MSTKKTIVSVVNPFEGNYDPVRKSLTLTHVESPSGECTVIQFSPQMTRALFDLLLATAAYCGGTVGEECERKTLQ